jgi:hypothetical protein
MVASEKHSQGAFLSSRSIFNSEIWIDKPPEYFKVFFYLYGKANHKGKTINGYTCERGEYFCSYSELIDQLEYHIGARKKKYNGVYMKRLMKYLRSKGAIDTTKHPRGNLIKVNNYDSFQDIKNYERTDERTADVSRSTPRSKKDDLSINKNDTRIKELQEKIPNCPYVQLMGMWNEITKFSPKMDKEELTETLKNKIRLRWKKHPDIEYWKKVFEKINETPWYNTQGKNNDWAAPFSWIFRNDDNHFKILKAKPKKEFVSRWSTSNDATPQ